MFANVQHLQPESSSFGQCYPRLEYKAEGETIIAARVVRSVDLQKVITCFTRRPLIHSLQWENTVCKIKQIQLSDTKEYQEGNVRI